MTAMGETIRRRAMWETRQKRARVRYQAYRVAELYILVLLGYLLFMNKERVVQLFSEVLFH